jgi:hypothetical protein
MKFEWNSEYIETILQFFRSGNPENKYLLNIEDLRNDRNDEQRELKIFNYLKGTKIKVLLFKTPLHYVNANFGTLIFSVSQNMLQMNNMEVIQLNRQIAERDATIAKLTAELDSLKEVIDEKKCNSLTTVPEVETSKRECPRKIKLKEKFSSYCDSQESQMGIELEFKKLKKLKKNK